MSAQTPNFLPFENSVYVPRITTYYGCFPLVCLAPMEVGINFFPDVRPEEKAADVYFDECLRLAAQADELGFHHIRIVEHYFERYGGYSPNPITFLSAASQRTRQIKLITGAVLPAFNHPLKLAGE